MLLVDVVAILLDAREGRAQRSRLALGLGGLSPLADLWDRGGDGG